MFYFDSTHCNATLRCATNDVSKIHIVDRHHPSAPLKKKGGSQTFTPSTIWFLFIAEAAQIKIRYFRDWTASKKRKSTSSGLRCCRRKWRNRWRTVHRWVPARPRPVWLLIWWSHRPPAVVAAMATKTNNRSSSSSSSKGRNRTPSWVSRNRIFAGSFRELIFSLLFFAVKMECPVCLQTCIHPAKLPCGHIFCFLCVKVSGEFFNWVILFYKFAQKKQYKT